MTATVPPHIAIITAGGAGMFCGSCMHDNTWARALMQAGLEVSLLPTYTPIRVDEPDVSSRNVLMGGLNVYLDYRWKFWQRAPRLITRWLDAPWLINLASRFSVSNEAAELGDLALAMLAGEAGPQRREVDDLAAGLAALRPDVVIFSNALLSGALRRVKEACPGPVLCVLQGDDVFLDGLPDSHRERAIAAVSAAASPFDAFIVHSQFYEGYISRYLRLPRERFRRLPLGIDPAGHDGRPGEKSDGPPTVGYFARVAPEKGLHHLAEAFRRLQRRLPEARLRIGGYLGPQHRRYLAGIMQTLSECRDRVEYVGSPKTHREKVAFYRSLDVLSVPTEFEEPKGLYVLEALANGVPVVQPRHGAFPELVESTGGGHLVEPRDPECLADALADLLTDRDRRIALGATGQQRVRDLYNPGVMARATQALLSEFIQR